MFFIDKHKQRGEVGKGVGFENSQLVLCGSGIITKVRTTREMILSFEKIGDDPVKVDVV